MRSRTMVIAEAGVNHNGSRELALRLVDAAADAGADVVKFQSFNAEQLVTGMAAKAAYQVANTGEGGAQLDMLRRLELRAEDHHAIVERCRMRGIGFMSTAFDDASLDLLAGLSMPAVKIASGDITHAPLLLRAARLGLPLIISTGMSTLADIEAALGVVAFALTRSGAPSGRADFHAAYGEPTGQAAIREQVTLLHCVTQYPAPAEAVNLRAMDTLAQAFGLPVGYSDHTQGTAVALAAVARGACVIEKHFTLSRTLPGPDHAASLEPDELKRLICDVRLIEQSLGSPIKCPAPAEVENLKVARRSVVAARHVPKGEALAWSAMAFKRPGVGLSPMDSWDLVGRPAPRDFDHDDVLEI